MQPKDPKAQDTNIMLQDEFLRIALAFSLGALFTLGGVIGGCWSAVPQRAEEFVTGTSGRDTKAKP